MKNSLLISSKYKVLGWIIFICFATLGIFCMVEGFEIPGFQLLSTIEQTGEDSVSMDLFGTYNLTNELALLGITVGLLMIVFAKEKIEDEFISMLRLKSLQWAVLLSYIVLIVINFTAYGLNFLSLLVYNLWTVLIIFIIRFYWSLYRLKKEEVTDEK
ncbi:hypothetical protein [Pedobacter terrae]|uniref:hypothetical protein n=1 Tax=Pedobacter terrae TaxID=405671 RepID=UPI002FFA218A